MKHYSASATLSGVPALERRIAMLEADLENLNNERDGAEAELSSAHRQIDDLEGEVNMYQREAYRE